VVLRYLIDSLGGGAFLSRPVGGCLLGLVDVALDPESAEWSLAVKKGRINSSPVILPFVPCSSPGVVWETNVNGDKRKGIALSSLVGMDLGCDGGNWQLVYDLTLCWDADIFNGVEAFAFP
jgi:hypothetical protein